jgi:hypothetical protein
MMRCKTNPATRWTARSSPSVCAVPCNITEAHLGQSETCRNLHPPCKVPEN